MRDCQRLGTRVNWPEEILYNVALAHQFKVQAVAGARTRTYKTSADILFELLRSKLLPGAYIPDKGTGGAKNILRQLIFFVRVQTMVRNRIYSIPDQHPKMTYQAPDVSDLFRVTSRRWLEQAVLLSKDKQLLSIEGIQE